MKKGTLLSKMLVFATNKHADQFDKAGMPYILHPLKVMSLVGDEEELQCIALGHDLVEDCDVTYQELLEAGFSDRVVKGISLLTKVPGETAEQYLDKVLSSQDSIRVKMADLKHNSDISRLRGVTEKDIARMVKYQLKLYYFVRACSSIRYIL